MAKALLQTMQIKSSVLILFINPAFLSLIRGSQVDQADHVGEDWGKEGTEYYGCPLEAPSKLILFWKEKKKGRSTRGKIIISLLHRERLCMPEVMQYWEMAWCLRGSRKKHFLGTRMSLLPLNWVQEIKICKYWNNWEKLLKQTSFCSYQSILC